MINSYREGKDLYAMIASKVYHNKYEDNKEFYPDGSMNIEGKHRRQSCKSLLLGMVIMPLYTAMCIDHDVNHYDKWVCS